MQGIGYPGNRRGWEANWGGNQGLEISGSCYHFYAGRTSRELDRPVETPNCGWPILQETLLQSLPEAERRGKTTHSPPPVPCHCLPSPRPPIPNIPGPGSRGSRGPGWARNSPEGREAQSSSREMVLKQTQFYILVLLFVC